MDLHLGKEQSVVHTIQLQLLECIFYSSWLTYSLEQLILILNILEMFCHNAQSIPFLRDVHSNTLNRNRGSICLHPCRDEGLVQYFQLHLLECTFFSYTLTNSLEQCLNLK